MQYQSLTFQFQESGQGGFRLRMSGGGEASETIDRTALESLLSPLPALAEEAEAGMADQDSGASGEKLRDVKMRHPQEVASDLGELGRRLFDMLFVGGIRDLFCSQWSELKAGERGLRLRLALDVTNPSLRPLQDLPWELLWYPKLQTPLAVDRRFSLVRSLDVPLPIRSKSPSDSLRCLVVGASPVGCEKLDIQGEMDRIGRALEGQGRVSASYLRSASREGIRHRLLEWPCDVLHFAGHGYDDEKAGLFLEDEAKDPVRLDAEEWAELVADLPLRLIVLNACSTARPSGTATQPFLGVAQALIRAGVPAVLAMREPIQDSAGVNLAKVLFERLAAGDPLDAAVVEARKALRQPPSGESSWSIPALFLRGSEDLLFFSSMKEGTDHSGNTLVAKARVSNVRGSAQSIVGAEVGSSSSFKGSVDGTAEVENLEGSGNQVIGVRIS